MHFLYCDETNLERRAGDFLIYGGLMIDADRAPALSAAIKQLRARNGVSRDYQLKFNPGPENLSHEEFIALKQEALEIAIDHGARLLVYVVLHDLAGNPDTARRYGINTVCSNFQIILEDLADDAHGLVLIDQFNDAGNQINAHLRDKFHTGLTLRNGRTRGLSRILGFHYSAIGQSHFPSLVDVALGSLRFAVNAHTRDEQDNLETAQRLLQILAPMFWRRDDDHRVPEVRFQFSPKTVKRRNYNRQYRDLRAFLVAAGLEIRQVIEDPIDEVFGDIP